LFGKIKIENYVQLGFVALRGDESSALIFSLAAYHDSFRSGQVVPKLLWGIIRQ